MGEVVMTAEPVCVSVSLTPLCFWLGAPNMLLFSNKWGAGKAHGRHRVYSGQDNSRAAAGLKFDLHTSAQSAAVMVERKCLWLQFKKFIWSALRFIPRSCAWSRNMWCTVRGRSTQIDTHRTKACSCREALGGIVYSRVKLWFMFMTEHTWSCKLRILKG